MGSCYGNNIKMCIFGESHGKAVGVTLDGIPAGNKIDVEELQNFLDRRAPGKSRITTGRKEEDIPEFISGINKGFTNGTPITAIIKNKDQRSKDYEEIREMPRPGHCDYTAHMKYRGYEDITGGGHFSGRLTAPLCVAGGICIQILEKEGIRLTAKLEEAGGEKENPEKAIERALEAGDSVGGIVSCSVTGVPEGVGEPIFDGIENKVASVIFGIPGVKGIEFGSGFAGTKLMGSENNDAFVLKDGKIETKTNNCGGILAGMSTGGNIEFKVAFKPTPSISKPQKTVNFITGKEEIIKITGRHDPCIALRAVPVVEAATAIAILDLLYDYRIQRCFANENR